MNIKDKNELYKRKKKAISDNPNIVMDFVKYRFKMFMKIILEPLFQVEEFIVFWTYSDGVQDTILDT